MPMLFFSENLSVNEVNLNPSIFKKIKDNRIRLISHMPKHFFN